MDLLGTLTGTAPERAEGTEEGETLSEKQKDYDKLYGKYREQDSSGEKEEAASGKEKKKLRDAYRKGSRTKGDGDTEWCDVCECGCDGCECCANMMDCL